MKSTVIERRAERLQLYTRLPWQSALHRVQAAAPRSTLIPQPHPHQVLLEAYLLHQLAWPRICTLRPWGIRHVDPRPASLKIAFEDEDVNRRHLEESMPRELARTLLPRADDTGGVSGITGVRVAVERDTIVLRRLGSLGSITLAGISPKDWRDAVDYQDEKEVEYGMTLCHRDSPNQWHPIERAYVGEYSWPTTDTNKTAWLASGLLRRAGLLRTVGVPLHTTAWTNPADDDGEQWIIEHEHEVASCPAHHQRFMALLTDPEWGLPLTETHSVCSCGRYPGESNECRVEARSSEGKPGELQMRFTRRTGTWLEPYKRPQSEYERRQRLYVTAPAPAAGSPVSA
ncbi:hypothetical protein ABR737_01150 [Streptomyces sp. Edi2]|uniref:hypothetical protein n=1 Tax=Streptomyces sp. Edi2 TaxID=3162528 RepID=UPI0033056E23